GVRIRPASSRTRARERLWPQLEDVDPLDETLHKAPGSACRCGPLQGSAMTLRADFTSQEDFRNPAAELAKLRAAGPVVEGRVPRVGAVWSRTTQELANQVLRDSETFTLRKENGNVVGLQWWMP